MSTEKTYAVMGIGNALIDLQIRATDAELEALQVPKGGMELVDLPRQQEILAKLGGRDSEKNAGGSAANTVAGMAQMGAATAYGCSYGDDPHGREYASQLQALGVRIASAPKDNEATGTSLILITPDAERTMNTNLAVSEKLTKSDIDLGTLEQAQWLYVEGYLFASPTAREAAWHAMEHAHAAGVKIALSFSDAFIVEAFRDDVTEATRKYVDLVFANSREAAAYTGKDDPQTSLELLLMECAHACVTDSANGSYINLDGHTRHIEAQQVQAIDQTGAGDMYAAGILFGLTAGWSPTYTGRLAAAAAAKVVAQTGARLQGSLQDLVDTYAP